MSNDKHRVIYWKGYNKGLENRGRINIWIASDMVEKWRMVYDVDCIKKKGGQIFYNASSSIVEG